MKRNVGSVDALARAMLGFLIVELGQYHHTWWGLVGLVPFLTAALAFSPLYCLLRLDTREPVKIADRQPPLSKTKNV